MDVDDLQGLVGDLSENVDDLETALAPLLQRALSSSTSKLPLLDKAKLYVLATYSLESLLFSALRLNGVDAKTHPVFQELNRVKEYFAKIKIAETGPLKRITTLDKGAAGRFIKAGLSGNDRFDRERTGREKGGVKRRLEDMQGVGSHIRFEGTAKRIRAAEEGENAMKLPAEEASTQDRPAARQRCRDESAAESASGRDDGEVLRTTSKAGRGKREKSSHVPKSAKDAFRVLVGGTEEEKRASRHDKDKDTGEQ